MKPRAFLAAAAAAATLTACGGASDEGASGAPTVSAPTSTSSAASTAAPSSPSVTETTSMSGTTPAPDTSSADTGQSTSAATTAATTTVSPKSVAATGTPKPVTSRPAGQVANGWNPAKGTCGLIDTIAADVLGEPAAITDEEVDTTGCTRRARSAPDTVAMALNQYDSSFDSYVAEATKGGLPAPQAVSVDGRSGAWFAVSGLARLVWEGPDGNIWSISYSGPNEAAKKNAILAAAKKINSAIG